MPLWIAAGAGKPDWDAIFAGYGSAVDYPICKFWRELMAHYPQAQLIHTARDPEQWFESTQAAIFSPNTMSTGAEGPFAAFFGMVSSGFTGRMHDRDFMIDHFHGHGEAVLAIVPKNRLLVFEASQGLEPLCAFLGVPVPDTDFPRENSRTDFQKHFLDGDARRSTAPLSGTTAP
ncbi:MAG: hypothetical protein JWM91_2555 [Rhodospirillales bacterium]|nr:hypothetical protein [Rhodospirillales bacterium]